MKFSKYTTKDTEEVFRDLKTSENGLSEKETGDRLKTYGFNEVKAKEARLIDIFLRQFKSPFSYLLFIAAIIAFAIGEYINALVIFMLVFINVCLGFIQEYRAEKAAVLLKSYVPLKTRILRGGVEKIIDKRFLVPGDMVLLKAGDIAPCDLRIIKEQNFLVDESILTGESVPVIKTSQPLFGEVKEIFEAKNIIFSSTTVISGQSKAIVVATGKEAVIGEITKLTSETLRESTYEKSLLSFSRLMLRIVITTIVLIFIANLIIKGTASFFEFLIFCIALIVSIIPEALPVVVTFALSRGALTLAKQKVVVKRLSAVEDLGNIEVLCTDKTGTLTENKLLLKNIYSLNKEKCLLYSLLASSYAEEVIDSRVSSFDLAIFQKAPQEMKESLREFKDIFQIPFDPIRLRNSILIQDLNKNRILIVKGAPEIILKFSEAIEGKNGEILPIKTELSKLNELIKKEGENGKRVIATSFKKFEQNEYLEEDEKGLTFLGYLSFIDPLKKTAKPSINLAKKLGVEIKILTGDSSEAAGVVAKRVGLIEKAEDVILGEKLDFLSEEDFDKVCLEKKVFARISPFNKHKIIKALQKHYEVGFMGEGINDAPALKLANVAIAVKGAADVSREASDIILLKKDLRVIVEGIRQGRNICSNISKYIKCTLASNFGNFYSIAAISLIIPFLPMLPVQILLINLLSDFPLIAVASDAVDIEELKKPKFYQLNQVILLIIFLALTSTIFDFIFFGIFHKVKPELLQTLWFIESILTEIVLIFSIRTRRLFFKTKRPSIWLINLALSTFLITIILPFTNFGQNIFQFVSPPIPALLVVLSLIFSYFVVSEIVKLIYFRYAWKNLKTKTK